MTSRSRGINNHLTFQASALTIVPHIEGKKKVNLSDVNALHRNHYRGYILAVSRVNSGLQAGCIAFRVPEGRCAARGRDRGTGSSISFFNMLIIQPTKLTALLYSCDPLSVVSNCQKTFRIYLINRRHYPVLDQHHRPTFKRRAARSDKYLPAGSSFFDSCHDKTRNQRN